MLSHKEKNASYDLEQNVHMGMCTTVPIYVLYVQMHMLQYACWFEPAIVFYYERMEPLLCSELLPQQKQLKPLKSLLIQGLICSIASIRCKEMGLLNRCCIQAYKIATLWQQGRPNHERKEKYERKNFHNNFARKKKSVFTH